MLGVMTHLNAPRFPTLTSFITGQGVACQTIMPLRDDVIHHAGQYVAVVVAETLEQAREAARLVQVDYETQPPRAELDGRLDEAYPPQPFFGGIRPDVSARRPGARAGRGRGPGRADGTPRRSSTTTRWSRTPPSPPGTPTAS